MAVTAFDGQFSFKQETVARLGDRAHRSEGMNEQDRERFMNSPFMQSMKRIDEVTMHKMSLRDKRRRDTDTSFQPRDEDFEAPKAYKYDKVMDYYKTLGVDEYAPLDDVKKAYKKLSLVYHPDKTAGLSKDTKEEYASIFMELKNAYQTLADNPTRRQYDRDRDRDRAAEEVNGWKRKERAQFDAREVLQKLMEEAEKKGPSKVIEVPIKARLEKFFYGGHKAIERERRIYRKKEDSFHPEERIFRIDVPRGTEEPFMAEFRQQGDQHKDARPDTLRFLVSSKPHEVVNRIGQDLHLKKEVVLGASMRSEQYMSFEAPSIRGRHILTWGVNPFFRAENQRPAVLGLHVVGEGIGESGLLSCTVRQCASAGGATSSSSDPKAAGEASSKQEFLEPQQDGRIVISIRHLSTNAELYMVVKDTFITVSEIRKQALAMLGLPRGSLLKLLKPLTEGKYTPWSDNEPLGDKRTFVSGGTEWSGVPLSQERALEFVQKGLEVGESAIFMSELERIARLPDAASRKESLRRLEDKHHNSLLPGFGRKPDEKVYKETLSQAFRQLASHPERDSLNKRLAAFAQAGNETMRGQVPSVADTSNGSKAPASEWAGPGPPRGAVGPEAPPEAVRSFLERFALGPPSGFDEDRAVGRRLAPDGSFYTLEEFKTFYGGLREWDAAAATASDAPLPMLKRLARRRMAPLDCTVRLAPMGGPVTLYTKPTCSVTFYSSVGTSPKAPPFFAVALASQTCARGGKAKEWELLKVQLLPVLQRTCFNMLAGVRYQLPRPIASTAAFPDGGQALLESGEPPPPTPWKRLGDEAFRGGHHWLAALYYSRCLEEEEGVEAAKVLSNRAAALAKAGDLEASLADARRAVELLPSWYRPWTRLGFAAAKLGGAVHLKEAVEAYSKAVQLAPHSANVEALFTIARRQAGGDSVDEAHAAKERGNMALRAGELGLAIAEYTIGLAYAPPKPAEGEDEAAMLRAVLLSNRSAVLVRLRNFDAAVDDAEQALKARADFTKAHCHLGIALLGSRQCERGYREFARCLQLEEGHANARKGRNECMRELLRWGSIKARKAMGRRLRDAERPRHTTRVFAISDVHFDMKANEEWAHTIDDCRFQEDVLIVAGNLADTKGAVVRGLTTLRSKFRRVFYTVGNHEMFIHPGEISRYPDSIAKLLGIFEACDELDVDYLAAPVAEGLFVVPLHSWYNAEFDQKDPWPKQIDEMDQHCRWPIDKDDQVWKFMLKLNEGHVGLPYHGTVISFSHFLPRRNLPFVEEHGRFSAKLMGCEMIDEQVRGVRSKLHVYGHSRIRHQRQYDGVMYVQMPLGYPQERGFGEQQAPVVMVYNGRAQCTEYWDTVVNKKMFV